MKNYSKEIKDLGATKGLDNRSMKDFLDELNESANQLAPQPTESDAWFRLPFSSEPMPIGERWKATN